MRVTKVDVTIPSSGYYLGYVSLVLDNAYTLNGVRITRRADGGLQVLGNTAQKSRRDTARSDIIRPWINR